MLFILLNMARSIMPAFALGEPLTEVQQLTESPPLPPAITLTLSMPMDVLGCQCQLFPHIGRHPDQPGAEG
jgi:hypothetical protein